MRYVYDSDRLGDVQRRVLDRLEGPGQGRIRLQDTAGEDAGAKHQLYTNILSPLAIINDRDLAVFRTDDGEVTYARGVLITPDDYYVGEEVLDALDALEARQREAGAEG